MSDKRTEIGDMGEFALIEQLASSVEITQTETIKGIGDDAAVYQVGDDLMVSSSDMLLEGIHFDLSYAPLPHLGYKAVSVNISDMAAMNAVPKQILVNIGLSNRFSVEAVEALYEGIRAACADYKVDLVGGDTTASRSGLVISITALGSVKKENITYRNGANNNDILCVTGDLGAAYIGLQVLEREKQEFLANAEMQPQLDKYPYVVGRQLRPKARMDIIHELRDLGVKPTAMIDVSDGLVSDAFHLCKQSGLGVALFEDKLPIGEETFRTVAEFNMDPNTCALNGGEDYELLFTISQADFEKLKNHEDIHMIGYMHDAENGKVMVTRKGNTIPLQAQGWKHF